MKQTIYLLEDEIKLNRLLQSYLEREGYLVKTFLTGKEAIENISEHPHLWVLDIMLPDIDGYEVLKQIKEDNPSTPVIFMSARDSDIDRLLGLQMGSDDYISKPFLPQELVLRCQNILKRVYGLEDKKFLKYEGYFIDLEKRMILYNQEEIKLTTKEYDLFHQFLTNLNKPLTREQILNHVWGIDFFGSDRVVDDLVRRLKKKCPQLKLESIYGYGYRLV